MTALQDRADQSGLAGYPLSPRLALERRAEAVLAGRDLYVIASAGYGKSGLLALIAAARSQVCVWASTVDAFAPENVADADLLIADISPETDRRSLQRFRIWLENPRRETRVLLAARTDPGLGLARLVSNKRGVIWRTSDLRCSHDDLRSVLVREEQGGSVDAARLNELHRMCDGWIAGAVLLHTERDAANLPQYIPQSVREYHSDILRTADLPIDQDLLSLSALPDQINPKLFQEITGSGDFFALVESGVDLQPVPNAPGWWRYGRLLSVCLRERAMALGQSVLSSTHRRISDWQLNEGALTESALHALQSGDQSLAMNVVDRAARRFIALGQITHARSWLTLLEPTGRTTYPRIWLHLITAQVVSGEYEVADTELAELEAYLERVHDRHDGEDWFDEIVLHTQFNRHMLAHMHPERRCDMAALDALVQAPRSRDFAVRGEALFLMGMAMLHDGNMGGYAVLEQSLNALLASQSWYAYAVAQRHLALREMEQGQLEACRQRCERATAQIVESTCFAPPCLAPIALVLAELELTEGNVEAVHRILANEGMPLQVLANEDLLAEWDRLTAELHTRAGAVSDASHMFRQALSRRTSNLGLGTRRKAQTALIRTLCQISRADEARALLGPRYGLEAPSNTPQTPGQLDALEDVVRSAIIMAALGETGRARRHFAQALTLIERRDAVIDQLRVARYILECQLSPEIDLALQRQVRDWIARVSEAGVMGLIGEAQCGVFGRHYNGGSAPALASRAVSAPRPGGIGVQVQLTPREQETLEYIALGHTNRQIADQTMTSLTTVKWHVSNILAKLQVQNRAAAINSARKLGLIA